ncbi:MAG TPA: MotA/TolQ/ExbB proton channel family protein [Steroidobacteraceae bacterium]|nr:MotA/TolQ/ExbB proton channel family protein [Steroidobacteraceae bacterium]
MADGTASIDNPYGIAALWTTSDYVGKSVFVILAFMSLYSWYVIITKSLDQRVLRKYAKTAEKDFWAASTLQDGLSRLKGGDDNAFRGLASDGLQSVEHHERNKGRLTENIDLHDWISSHLQRRVDTIQSDLGSGMSVLASVGSTAPFVGLFGTVWGIYHALIAIGISGQASIDKVAGPVGEALIMTAMGLAVAVPAVLGFNWLTRRNKFIIERVNYFAHDLHQALLSGARVSMTAKPAAGAAPAAAVRK